MSRRSGYTLIEILLATSITLVMMTGVVQVFGMIGRSITDSRAVMEMSDRLRATSFRLKADLEGLTVTVCPPDSPEKVQKGCLEYTEGIIGPVSAPPAVDSNTGSVDLTAGDTDDMLLLTTRSRKEPFLGRALVKRWPRPGETQTGSDAAGPFVLDTSVESQEAEIVWFTRGSNLYRRVLLILPDFDADLRTPGREMQLNGVTTGAGFYRDYDISVRMENGVLVPNTLADLARPENRYAHRSIHQYSGSPQYHSGFPYHPHFTCNFTNNTVARSNWANLGMPTLFESSFRPSSGTAWLAGGDLPVIPLNLSGQMDLWRAPFPATELDGANHVAAGAVGQHSNFFLAAEPDANRGQEDLILTNVLAFDVKAWDPGAPTVLAVETATSTQTVVVPGDPNYAAALTNAGKTVNGVQYAIAGYGAYVDLNYLATATYATWPSDLPPRFGVGDSRSLLRGIGGSQLPAVYDTWSYHYDAAAGTAVDGFDNDGNGAVDDDAERQFPAPYRHPLRALQVKIRVFDRDSRQIREVTLVNEFLPK